MRKAITLNKITITSQFWQRYRKLVAQKSVPFQWKMISDQEKPKVLDKKVAGGASKESNAIKNLKIAAGLETGNHSGMVFQDTDVYKWLETVAYVLKYDETDNLKILANKVIDLISKAQDKDGYLSTRYQIDTPELKFKQLQQSHELYSMGHFIEAGVAYYKSTGNEKALLIAEKMADCIDNYFGNEKNKIHGYDGHPEIELALAKLYECTKKKKYLALANYFVKVRGTESDFFTKQNAQNDVKFDPFPDMRNANHNYFFDEHSVDKQRMAQGHAVRVLYYLTGVMHVARLTDDIQLKQAAEYLWNDITQKQMYITGNVGQTAVGEAFTYDYDLPNLTDYGETCASVAMVMFARQMLENKLSGEYGDIIERELYNGALAGISLDGEHYFYANALEFGKNSRLNPASSHLSNKRLSWFSCACCPANITRLLASIDNYVYVIKENTILFDQLISNKTYFSNNILFDVESELPWGNSIKIKIKNPESQNFVFKMRIPSWSKNFRLIRNGQESKIKVHSGLVSLKIKRNEEIKVLLCNDIDQIHANPRVIADQGKVALQKGPIVYCTEEVDNQGSYANYVLPSKLDIDVKFEKNLLNGVQKLTVKNAKYVVANKLYSKLNISSEQRELTLVPYFAWANRKPGSMTVWIRQEEK